MLAGLINSNSNLGSIISWNSLLDSGCWTVKYSSQGNSFATVSLSLYFASTALFKNGRKISSVFKLSENCIAHFPLGKTLLSKIFLFCRKIRWYQEKGS